MDSTRPTASLNPAFLEALQEKPSKRRKPGKPKGPHQQKSPEAVYSTLIQEGKVKIVRRRGRPPLIVWL